MKTRIIILFTLVTTIFFANDLQDYFDTAIKLGNQGKYDEAVKYYNKIISVNPNIAEIYVNRGILYTNLKKYKESLADFTKAIKISPKDATTYSNRGFVYNVIGEYNLAIKDFDKSLLINPKNSDAYNNIGISYFNIGNYEKAINSYEKAIEYDENNYNAYNNRGFCYYMLEDYDKSINDLSIAINQTTNYENAIFNRSLAYLATQDYESSLIDIDKALSLNDNALYYHFIKLLDLYHISKKDYYKYKRSLKNKYKTFENDKICDELLKYYTKPWRSGRRVLKKIGDISDTTKCEVCFYLGLRYYFWRMKYTSRKYFDKAIDTKEISYAEYHLANQLRW